MADSHLDGESKADESDESRTDEELSLPKVDEVEDITVELQSLPEAPSLIEARSLMPESGRLFDEFKRREIEYSIHENEDVDQADYEGYVRFKLGNSGLYGIPYRNVIQVIPARKITLVPCSPNYVCGVINWRGMLLTILNISGFFGVSSSVSNEDKQIVVATVGSITVGILIDSLDGNDVFLSSDLEPPLASLAVKDMSYIEGIHHGCISILNVNKILIDENISGSAPIVF